MIKKRKNTVGYVVAGIITCAAIAYFLFRPAENIKSSTPDTTASAGDSALPTSPGFTKEGELSFFSGDQLITKIDIEIAENEMERVKGLMYRSVLPKSAGMLFIFDQAQAHSFWMKNTAIPLDILYVSQDKKIVSIHKQTKPFSEESIPSLGEAQYVVEVNAGFTDQFKIKVGDKIDF